jgi:polyhydroxyalkanoate synthesis regulator phasin
MADAADNGLRDAVERLGLAALGAVALTAERADALADELSRTGGMRREEVREQIDQATRRWRGEAVRVGEKAGAGLEGVFHQLGLVTRAELEELELRLAQLEHRLRLVEEPRSAPETPH